MCVPANRPYLPGGSFAVSSSNPSLGWHCFYLSTAAGAAADVHGQAIAGVAAGSSIGVEEGDRQFRTLDVGVVTEAGERNRWGAQPG
jgi:hypothetical protein